MICKRYIFVMFTAFLVSIIFQIAAWADMDKPAKTSLQKESASADLSVKSSDPQVDEAARAKIMKAYGKLPLSFIENQGQINKKALYYTKTGNQSIYFTNDGIVFDLRRRMQKSGVRRQKSEKGRQLSVGSEKAVGNKQLTGRGEPLRSPVADGNNEKAGQKISHPEKDESARLSERLVFTLEFENSNKGAIINGEDIQKGRINYLTGSDRKKRHANIPTYKGIVYSDVYKGVDLRVFGSGADLEYEFIVKPGANPDKILLSYAGIDGLKINKAGELIIRTAFGELKESKPYIYQVIDGKKVEVAGAFKIKDENRESVGGSQLAVGSKKAVGNNQRTTGNSQVAAVDPKSPIQRTEIRTNKFAHAAHQSTLPTLQSSIVNPQSSYGFQVAAYNPDYTLVIDPTLIYSTFLGGSEDDDSGFAIAVDDMKNVYVTGNTQSTNFPTANAIQGSLSGSRDAFVMKLNAAGDTLLFLTYLGGD